MSGLYDYILWMGDYPFSAVPFQEVDAVILSLLAYIDFSPMFEQAGEALLRDCREMIDAGQAQVQGMGKAEAYLQILKAATASRRFGALRMSDYVDILYPEVPLQFAAVCFHDEAGWSFLAYRGTDNTLAGWKEDFMISFTHTQAQEMAVDYAEKRIGPDRAWYIGGHSKGGNLALYAARNVSEATLAPVRRVFLLDGPGFCPEVIAPRDVSNIDAIITRIIPGFSVIGALFEPRIRDTRIVRSSASGLLQHDLSSWEIDHGKLATLPELDAGANIINTILNKWIGDMDRADREVFVNEVFGALGAGGAETLEELVTDGYKGFDAIRHRFQSSSEITKRIFKDLSHQAIQSVFDAVFRNA